MQDIAIRAKVTVKGDNLKIDFTGTDAQTPGFVNSPVPNTYSYVFLTLSSMIDDSIPRNEGLLAPIEMILPPGSVVNPNPPAPCTACTLHAGGEAGQAVAVALEKAIPEKAYIQNIKLAMPVVTFGINPDTSEFYVDQNVMMAAGWTNAAYGLDGWGALAPFFGAMTMGTGEIRDMIYPADTLGREYITDSGGPGKWRGGLGTRNTQRARAPYFAHTYVIGNRFPMPGFKGGMDGSRNKLVLRSGQPNEVLVETTAFNFPMSAGDTFYYELGGGGGWGDPLERDPLAVLEDVIDEYVSIEAAGKYYGVVIDEKSMSVDQKGTETLRVRIRKDREQMKREKKEVVAYLSPKWKELCQKAVNDDAEYRRLAGNMTMDLNNIVENCPDGKTRFLYWRFKDGKLLETVIGEMHEMGDLKPIFTTLASYDTFMKINTAKLSVETAVTSGLLRFEGDLATMMTYTEALNRFTEVRRTIPTAY